MKKLIFLFISFVLLITQTIDDKSSNKKIIGYYKDLELDVYYIVNQKEIIRLSFGDQQWFPCDEILNVEKVTYTFNNDTLIFNFGQLKACDNYYKQKWIYLDEYNDFIDYESGEYIRISKEVLDDKLKQLNLTSLICED